MLTIRETQNKVKYILADIYSILVIGTIFKSSQYLLLYICMVIICHSLFSVEKKMHYFIDHRSKKFSKEKLKGFFSGYLMCITNYIKPEWL